MALPGAPPYKASCTRPASQRSSASGFSSARWRRADVGSARFKGGSGTETWLASGFAGEYAPPARPMFVVFIFTRVPRNRQ